MKNLKENFLNSIKTLLKSETLKEEIKSAENFINNFEIFFQNEILKEKNKKQTLGGIALSSKHAKDCLEDSIRTVRFLKGIYEAIETLKERFANEKISILYAGCGPLGTIVLPLLGLLSSEKIEVTLLDINESSINTIKKIVKKLEYEDYIKEYTIADAIKYIKPKDVDFHLIVSETMDKALTKEPQVEIIRNLGNQLIKNGIFIPEEIQIKKGYSFFAKEFIFDLKRKSIEIENQELLSSQEKLFTITKDIGINENSFCYDTDWIKKPKNFDKNPDICLYTEVVVYDDIKLNKAESFITNPICVKSLYTIKEKEYKLKYSTKGIPNWKIIEK